MTQPPDKMAGDAWTPLRRYTAARIGLPRSGASLATTALLDFRLAHARARDAVSATLDEAKLVDDLRTLGRPILTVSSVAADHQQFLMRPDLGRRLAPEAAAIVAPYAGARPDVVFVIADGLSACAAERHAPPLLAHALPGLAAGGYSIAPLIVARRARVALGDAVAAALHADMVVMLIGERPGLTAPDSMGAYLTWEPGARTTDADRNCISNIRPEGLGYADAAFRLTHLLRAMRRQRMSGVRLKDETDRLAIDR